MSDSVQEAPVPLAVFAATLRPQQTGTRSVQARAVVGGRRTAAQTPVYAPGHPDQIWLKLLQIKHGLERRTRADWQALIDKYGQTPAHTADARYAADQ